MNAERSPRNSNDGSGESILNHILQIGLKAGRQQELVTTGSAVFRSGIAGQGFVVHSPHSATNMTS